MLKIQLVRMVEKQSKEFAPNVELRCFALVGANPIFYYSKSYIYTKATA